MKFLAVLISLFFCGAVFAEEKKAPAAVATVADAMVARETTADKPETKPARLAPGESKRAETRPAVKKESKSRYFGFQESVLKNMIVHGSVKSSIPMKKLEMCFAYMQPFWVGWTDQRSEKKCVALNNGNTLCPGGLFSGQNNDGPFGKYFKFDKGVFGNKNIFLNEKDDYVGFIEVEPPTIVSIAVNGVKGGAAKVAIDKWRLVWEEKVLDIATGISQSYFIAKAKVQVKKSLKVDVYIYYSFHLNSDSYRYEQIRCYAGSKYPSCEIKW
ncbi:MAG: hypothetical protein V1928_01205 [Parcubacteria group bacterium]